VNLDKEVALEEEVRADLQLGVLVDRQRRVLELHRHPGGAALRDRLDLGDLADVHAGDADLGARLQVVRRLEHRSELVWVGERIPL
jgi:hypothetical protein